MDCGKLMEWSMQPVRAAVPNKGCDVKLCMFQFDDLYHRERGKELKGDTITANNVLHCNLLVLRVLVLLQVTYRG